MTKPELLRRLHDLWESGLLIVHPSASEHDTSEVYAVIAHLYDWHEANEQR